MSFQKIPAERQDHWVSATFCTIFAKIFKADSSHMNDLPVDAKIALHPQYLLKHGLQPGITDNEGSVAQKISKKKKKKDKASTNTAPPDVSLQSDDYDFLDGKADINPRRIKERELMEVVRGQTDGLLDKLLEFLLFLAPPHQ
ncbi:hypothetical protein Sjap_005649 [Stephania japonica]|uniref:Uncharacterized protein n=1 Tax=Stephania japonica TaxID=461633 RepID=A0AAP0K4P0_9MAGN